MPGVKAKLFSSMIASNLLHQKNAMPLSQNACRIQLFQLTSQSKHGPVAVLAFLGFFKFSPKSNPTSWTLWTEKPKTWNHVPSWFPSCCVSWPISLDFRRKTPTDTRMHHASFIYASNPAAMPIEHITTHQQNLTRKNHQRYMYVYIYICVSWNAFSMLMFACEVFYHQIVWLQKIKSIVTAITRTNCTLSEVGPEGWIVWRKGLCIPILVSLLHGKNSSHMSPHQRLANEYLRLRASA